MINRVYSTFHSELCFPFWRTNGFSLFNLIWELSEIESTAATMFDDDVVILVVLMMVKMEPTQVLRWFQM